MSLLSIIKLLNDNVFYLPLCIFWYTKNIIITKNIVLTFVKDIMILFIKLLCDNVFYLLPCMSWYW